jgi:hypothetical protein
LGKRENGELRESLGKEGEKTGEQEMSGRGRVRQKERNIRQRKIERRVTERREKKERGETKRWKRLK